MAAPLDSILQSYVAAKNAAHQSATEDLAREQMQETHDFHQKALDQAAKEHEANLKLNLLHTKTLMQQQLNQQLGTPDQAPYTAQQPQVNTGLPNTPQEGQVSGTTSAQPWQYSNPEMQGAGISPVTIDPNYVGRQIATKAAGAEAENAPFLERYTEMMRQQGIRNAAQEHQRAQDQINLERAKQGLSPYNFDQPGGGVPSAQQGTPSISSGPEGLDPGLQKDKEAVQQFRLPWEKITPPGKRQAIGDSIVAEGGKIPTPQDRETIDSLGNIQSIYKQFAELAHKYSADSPQGGLDLLNPNNLREYLADSKSALSQVGPLAKRLDMNNRSSDSEMARQFGGLFSKYANEKTNLDNIQKHADNWKAKLESSSPGPNSNFLQALKSRGVTVFDKGIRSLIPNMDVPQEIQDLLKNVAPGDHNLTDGSTWRKDANGNISKIK